MADLKFSLVSMGIELRNYFLIPPVLYHFFFPSTFLQCPPHASEPVTLESGSFGETGRGWPMKQDLGISVPGRVPDTG